MKRISDEKLQAIDDELCGDEVFLGLPDNEVMLYIARRNIQAQLEACEKEANEKVRELFDKIEKSGLVPLICDEESYVDEIRRKQRKHLPNCKSCKWQALKEGVK